MRFILGSGLLAALLTCAATAPAQDWQPATSGSGCGVKLRRPVPLQPTAEPQFDTQVRPVTYSEVRIQRPMPIVRAKIDMPQPLPPGTLPDGRTLPGNASEFQSEMITARPAEIVSAPGTGGMIIGTPGPSCPSCDGSFPTSGIVSYGTPVVSGQGVVIDGAVINGGIVHGGIVSGGIVDGGMVHGSIVSGGVVDGGMVHGGIVNGTVTNGGIVSDGMYYGDAVPLDSSCGSCGSGTCGNGGCAPHGGCGLFGGCGAGCGAGGCCNSGGCYNGGCCDQSGCGDGCCAKPWHSCLLKKLFHCGDCQDACAYGCDPCGCYPRPRFWVGGEYINWTISNQNSPTLVTAQGGGGVLFGPQQLNNDTTHSGARAYLGFWCASNPCLGFDVSWFTLGRETSRTAFGASTVLGTDVDPAIVSNTQYLWSIDANIRKKMCIKPNGYCDLLIGYRHLQFMENLALQTSDGTVRSDTRNVFNGGQVGFDTEYRFLPKWSIGATVKVAFGSIQQDLRMQDNGLVVAGGAQQSFQRNVFAVVPEAQFRLVHTMSEKWRVYVAYNVIAVSSTVRPGDNIDPNSSSGFFPAIVRDQTMAAHGVSIGLMATY